VGLNIEAAARAVRQPLPDISLSFRHFFTRKVMFAKVATAFIVLPAATARSTSVRGAHAGADRQDRQMPIVLVHEPFWRGLLEWMRERPGGRGHDRHSSSWISCRCATAAGSGRRHLRFLREARLRAFAPGARGVLNL